MSDYPIYFLACLLIGACWCYGIFKIFDDLLIPVRAWIELKLGPKWSKPLITCPPCMGSLHGLVLGSIFYPGSWFIILYCVALCGLNYLIQQFLPEYE